MSWNDIPSWAFDVSRAIMQTVNAKDPDTYEHCLRVSRGARLLAQAAGLNEYEQKVIEFAGLFHDIGKIGVPDEILNKPTKLTDAEYDVMKSHPVLSARIIEPLAKIPFFQALLPGILHHHERVDGLGYPFKKAGDDIPIEARIILIADTFDAMTMSRIYRKALTPEVAHKELRDFAGRQFDPHLVKIFNDAQRFWAKQEDQVAKEMDHFVLKRSA